MIPRAVFVVALALASMSFQGQAQQAISLPRQPDSVRFAAIGDMGTGSTPQYEVGARMDSLRQLFSFEFVITLGDNI